MGIKEKWPQSYLSYFSTGFHWRIFLLSRANRLYAIFNTGLRNLGSLVSQIFFCLQPGVNGYGSVCHEPCSKTNISSRFFRQRGEGCHFRFRVPANHWLLPSSPPGQAILLGLLDVTQVRLLLIQTAVIPLPSSQWDIAWQYIDQLKKKKIYWCLFRIVPLLYFLVLFW